MEKMNEYKQNLREEIQYMKNHNIDEICKKYESLPIEVSIEINKKKKREYDLIPEDKIEEYINNSWIQHISEMQISKVTNEEGIEFSLLVDKVEDFGLEDYKFKEQIKQNFKNIISTFGVTALGLNCIVALVSIIAQLPSVLLTSLIATGIIVPFGIGFSLLKDNIIKNKLQKEEAVKILKEKGIYDILVDKMVAKKEIEEIKNTGKVM